MTVNSFPCVFINDDAVLNRFPTTHVTDYVTDIGINSSVVPKLKSFILKYARTHTHTQHFTYAGECCM